MDDAKFSPTDYLTMLDRFVTNGDVFEFENSVQMDFPRAINYDPILVYLQHLMKDPLIQSRVLGNRLAGRVVLSSNVCMTSDSSIKWLLVSRHKWRR